MSLSLKEYLILTFYSQSSYLSHSPSFAHSLAALSHPPPFAHSLFHFPPFLWNFLWSVLSHFRTLSRFSFPLASRTLPGERVKLRE